MSYLETDSCGSQRIPWRMRSPLATGLLPSNYLTASFSSFPEICLSRQKPPMVPCGVLERGSHSGINKAFMYAASGSDGKTDREPVGKRCSASGSFCCMQKHTTWSDNGWFVTQDSRDIDGVNYFTEISETLVSVSDSQYSSQSQILKGNAEVEVKKKNRKLDFSVC